MEDMNNSSFEYLKAQEKILKDKLFWNKVAQEEFLVEFLIKKHGINVGDSVQWTIGGQINKGVVKAVLPYGGYIVNKFNKSGIASKINTRVYRNINLIKKES